MRTKYKANQIITRSCRDCDRKFTQRIKPWGQIYYAKIYCPPCGWNRESEKYQGVEILRGNELVSLAEIKAKFYADYERP